MSDPVTYTAVLPVAEETVQFVSGLLAAERRRRGTRGRRRALGCYRQAVLLLRWFLDGTRLAQLASDNRIGRSMAYRYLHEGVDVLAAAAPGLRGALLAPQAAGHAHVTADGTLIRTDRCHIPGPTARTDRHVDLWWLGKYAAHGGSGQVIATPDGWPIWTSDVRPGREHDTTALRTHPEALPLLAEWTDAEHAVLTVFGYEGERAALTTPIKKTSDAPLTDDERTVNLLHAATRAPAERGNSLLKTTVKALRRVSLCPCVWRDHRRRPHSAPPPARPDPMITDQVGLLLRMTEVFSPGFAVRGPLGEASLQVRPLGQRSAECRLPGACAEGPRPKSLTTR